MENFTSPEASHDTSGSEGSEAAPGGMTEEFKTPPQEKQEAMNNPPQKVRETCSHLHSGIWATRQQRKTAWNRVRSLL